MASSLRAGLRSFPQGVQAFSAACRARRTAFEPSIKHRGTDAALAGAVLHQHYTCTVTYQAPVEAMMATYPQAAKEPATRTAMDAPRILAADDQPHILDAIELLLQPQGYRVTRAQSPREVRDRVASETFDAILIDLNYTRDTTSGAEGLELLAQLSAHDSRLRIIVMTAWANVDLAVESMRRGACDFIQKPWENARLISIVRTQIELRRAVQQAEILEAENRLLRAEGRPELIAKASSMQPVLELLARIGPSDANVLITGEHGTGKEIVAQTLHALSSRSSRSLVAVNTGPLA